MIFKSREVLELIVFLLIFLLHVSPAQAYIDPGTGASFVGSIGPIILALFAACGALIVKYFWNPIKGLLLKFRGQPKDEQ